MPKKASDIFNETNFAFATKGTFVDAYPDIKEMELTVTELESLMWMKEQRTHHLTEKNPGGEYVDCTNPSCKGGGVSIGMILRDAVSNNKTEVNETVVCKGTETIGRRCMHAFTVIGSIKYKM